MEDLLRKLFIDPFIPKQQFISPVPAKNTLLNPTAIQKPANSSPQNNNLFHAMGQALLPYSAKAQAAKTTPTPTQEPYRPAVVIPYSQGGTYEFSPDLSQVLLNSFNDVNQATPAATVLNHPPSNSFIPTDPQSNNHINMGENASFKTDNIDVKNENGTIDRGLFRINSGTFDGMKQNPYWNKRMQDKNITSWDDMNDPQKNADMARLIWERGGGNFEQWFAAPRKLRLMEGK